MSGEGHVHVMDVELGTEVERWLQSVAIWSVFKILMWQWLSLMRVTLLNTFTPHCPPPPPHTHTHAHTCTETLMHPDSLFEGSVGVDNGCRLLLWRVGRKPTEAWGWWWRICSDVRLMLKFRFICSHTPQGHMVIGWQVTFQTDPTHHPRITPSPASPSSHKIKMCHFTVYHRFPHQSCMIILTRGPSKRLISCQHRCSTDHRGTGYMWTSDVKCFTEPSFKSPNLLENFRENKVSLSQ